MNHMIGYARSAWSVEIRQVRQNLPQDFAGGEIDLFPGFNRRLLAGGLRISSLGQRRGSQLTSSSASPAKPVPLYTCKGVVLPDGTFGSGLTRQCGGEIVVFG